MKKNKSNPISNIILIIAIIVFAISGFMIIRQLMDYRNSNDLYSDLGASYVTVSDDDKDGSSDGSADSGNSEADGTEADGSKADDSEAGSSGTETESDSASSEADRTWPKVISVDFSQLKKENKDVCGWLYFENEDISYPVVWSGDNSTYLRTSFDGKKATAGTLFVEGADNPDFQDSYTIIYGHNMRNLSMFGKLKYYYRDESYYADHQYFQIATEDAVYRYHIFAYKIVKDTSYVYSAGYQPDEAFGDFIKRLKSDSLISPDIPVDQNDKIITLSTCTKDDGRFVIHAVLVDEKLNE